jgi:signal transduction histidine kinase
MTKKQRENNNTEIDLSSHLRVGTTRRVIVWLVDNSVWILGLMILLLISFEAYDFTHPQNKSVYFIEFIFFVSLLGIIGLLLNSLAQGIRDQKRNIRVLDAKHKLSLELSGCQDWDGLVDHIVRFPASLASVHQTSLFVSNNITSQFVLAAQWSRAGEDSKNVFLEEPCQDCTKKEGSPALTFRQCTSEIGTLEGSLPSQRYCLLVMDQERTLGLLQFSLSPGKKLTAEQADIFRNIGDEIAVSLKAGQDRKALSELRMSETALAERRSVSHYLHDHLGQSLGFLHLKMDQLLTERKQVSLERVLEDLELMRNAAYESYEIVRGILETSHPETTQTLTNLLLEYSRKISSRSRIEIDFKTMGTPFPLSDEIQKAVFYAFEESLSNVEKHAQATRVAILAEWKPDHFEMTISDNGVGFNPDGVNTEQHFGLEILNERMAVVNGRITLTTRENLGTVINIRVPNTSPEQLGAGV